MQTGLTVLGVGAVIMFLSFVYALVNMGRTAKQAFSNTGPGISAAGKGFGRHIGAMIGMAIGGFVSVIGVILAVAAALAK